MTCPFRFERVGVATARQELSLPPKVTYGQIKGFTLHATRTILSGEGSGLIEFAGPTCGNWTSIDPDGGHLHERPGLATAQGSVARSSPSS
jgi:hypothetical protein